MHDNISVLTQVGHKTVTESTLAIKEEDYQVKSVNIEVMTNY